MSMTPLLQKVDAVQVPVPDLDTGLRFYHDGLGQELRWRNDEIGQARAGDTGQRYGDRLDDGAEVSAELAG